MKDVGNKDVMAKNLKFYMAQKGIKAGELSKAISVPYTTVRSWMRAENYPRIDKIEDMADYFGILKSDLIEDKKEPADYNDRLTQKKLDFIEKVKPMSEAELDRLDQILRIVENTK